MDGRIVWKSRSPIAQNARSVRPVEHTTPLVVNRTFRHRLSKTHGCNRINSGTTDRATLRMESTDGPTSGRAPVHSQARVASRLGSTSLAVSGLMKLARRRFHVRRLRRRDPVRSIVVSERDGDRAREDVASTGPPPRVRGCSLLEVVVARPQQPPRACGRTGVPGERLAG